MTFRSSIRGNSRRRRGYAAAGLSLALACWAGLGAGLRDASAESAALVFFGQVTGGGQPVPGAMVTFSHGDPAHAVTVFSDGEGRYRSPALEHASGYGLRVRRIGWQDAARFEPAPGNGRAHDFVLDPVTSSEELAAQLPANHWYALVLDELDDPAERAELKQQCTYCHQQGNAATRRERTHEEWEKLLVLMGRRGGMLTSELREKLPDVFMRAYAPAAALEKLAPVAEAHRALGPGELARRAIIEEWDLGGRASNQHDVMVHPDGRIYSVDGPQDLLHRLDLSVPGGRRDSWQVPRGDLPPGGVFAEAGTSTSNSHVAPHSLQTAPDGAIWITLAIGNQLARFDPRSEAWTIHEIDAGIYPHTLRFDSRGRFWYTMAATNHVGMFDPLTNEQRHLRLPARTWTQELILRAMPAILWIGRTIDIRGSAAESDGIMMPVPYGIDIAPDDGVWFSQLNEHRIGRIDPDTLELELIETPFATPRRLRFDASGGLWIPSFSEGLLAHFDPATRVFRTWPLPIEPLGSETPYALAVSPLTGDIWICGTNSDTMIRFQPEREAFTVYPLPTRVTYTREVDFDAQGRIWTSNSNGPTWQIEGGQPKVIRIDPNEPPPATAATR